MKLANSTSRVQRFPEKALVLQDECLPKFLFCMTNSEKLAYNHRGIKKYEMRFVITRPAGRPCKKKSLVPAHFVLINTSGRVDPLTSTP